MIDVLCFCLFQIPDYAEPYIPKDTPEYATIIDGKALAQYLPPTGFTELSARFLEFMMKCKVVICCRVSPLQKVCTTQHNATPVLFLIQPTTTGTSS